MQRESYNEESIFASAIEIASPADREAYIEDACGENPKLHDRLRALLKSHDEESKFLQPPVRPAETETLLTEKPGTIIGPYKLLQNIGEGGFGVVYMAEQKEPIRRKVALKIIKLGMDTRQVIARFEAERQALAMMDHPNIARVLDAGSTETGRPYFVMELVRGDPITEYCDSQHVDTNERLRLFIDVCHAVQHAHQKGIIHRDIKPSNVMVTMHDGKAVPKVIDFGIAKATQHELTEKTLFTEYRQFLGTPAYMSPEQAEMSGLGVDTRSDIYSLGVLLYELLTSTTPFEAEQFRRAAFDEIVKMIRETEPPKPSLRLHTLASVAHPPGKTDATQRLLETAKQHDGTSSIMDIARLRHTDPESLTRSLRGDLDWIVMRALEKDRGRRYETAKDLAVDIGRHLNNEPVLASPPSTIYRLRKYTRRNRSLVMAGSLVAASLFVGLIASVSGFLQAAHQRDRALLAEHRAVVARDEVSRERDLAQREKERAIAAEAAAEQRREETERQREEAEAVIALLSEMIGSANPEDLKGPNFTVRQLLEDFSAKLEGRLTDQPAVEATVRLMVSDVYQQFRMHYEGQLHAERAHQLRRNLYGDEHELTTRALRAYGLHLALCPLSSQSQEGYEILGKIIEMRPAFMDEDHEFRIRTKNGAALFLRGQPKVDRFAELLEEAESHLGKEHHITSIVRSNYAVGLLGVGSLDEAETQFRLAVEAQEMLGGPDDLYASIFRGKLARTLSDMGDDESAQQILLNELPFQHEQLGHWHRDALVTLTRLMTIFYKQEEAQSAHELWSEYVEGMRNDEEQLSLVNLHFLVKLATQREVARTPIAGMLLDKAGRIYMNRIDDVDADSAPWGQGLGVSIARGLIVSDRDELAEQVTLAAWKVYGNKLSDADLVSTFVRAMLTNGKLEAAVNFVQQELSAEAASFRELDKNGDGRITSTELPAFWLPSLVAKIDTNSDETVSTEEFGESRWPFVADADLDEDGSVDPSEAQIVLRNEAFTRLDTNSDGTLTGNEIASFARSFDTDGDETVTREEFLPGRRLRSDSSVADLFARSLTAEEEFLQADQNGDDTVSIDEADVAFWKSISEFDTNRDETVDLAEYEQGLQQQQLETADRFFTKMDRNSDGHASQEEVPSRLWERWREFDANGDQVLNKDEFMKARKGQTATSR